MCVGRGWLREYTIGGHMTKGFRGVRGLKLNYDAL